MRYQLQGLPDGVAGVRSTLRLMRGVVNKYRASPIIRELAMAIVRGLRQKDFYGEAGRIFEFVRDRIRYVKDIRGVETLQSPEQTLRLGQGDCDDKSMLIAALLESIGHKTQFVAVGMSPGTFAHVFPQVLIRGEWVTMDATEPWRMGQNPQNIKAVMVQGDL